MENSARKPHKYVQLISDEETHTVQWARAVFPKIIPTVTRVPQAIKKKST